MNYSLPVSSVHGLLQEEYWSLLPFPPAGDLPNPGIKPLFLMSPALAGRFFPTSAAMTSSMLFRTVSNLVNENRKKQERLVKVH